MKMGNLNEKKITEAGLRGAHMINMAVLLKWNVANGDGEGWWRWWVWGVGQDGGRCCHGF